MKNAIFNDFITITKIFFLKKSWEFSFLNGFRKYKIRVKIE